MAGNGRPFRISIPSLTAEPEPRHGWQPKPLIDPRILGGVDESWYEENFGASRFREVAEGASYWERVDIVGDDAQSGRIRTMLEEMLLSVRTFPVGQRQHFVNVVGGAVSDAPYLILAVHGHGDGDLIVPGELVEGQTGSDRFGPQDVRRSADLSGRNVLCLACESGSAAMGDAFLDAGAAAYAAPAGSPFVQTSTLFAILVFRELAFRGGTFGEAVRRARSYDEETGNWMIYEREAP